MGPGAGTLSINLSRRRGRWPDGDGGAGGTGVYSWGVGLESVGAEKDPSFSAPADWGICGLDLGEAHSSGDNGGRGDVGTNQVECRTVGTRDPTFLTAAC